MFYSFSCLIVPLRTCRKIFYRRYYMSILLDIRENYLFSYLSLAVNFSSITFVMLKKLLVNGFFKNHKLLLIFVSHFKYIYWDNYMIFFLLTCWILIIYFWMLNEYFQYKPIIHKVLFLYILDQFSIISKDFCTYVCEWLVYIDLYSYFLVKFLSILI